MSLDTLYNLLSNDSFLSVNKTLAKEIGVIPAVMLAELIGEQKYWSIREELDREGFFYSTIENIEENCGLNRSQQDIAVKELIKFDLLDKKVLGLPRKRYFKVKPQNILNILSKPISIKETKADEFDLTKVPNNVKILIESFIEGYKSIDKEYFTNFHLKENYELTKQDIEACILLTDEEIVKLIKIFNNMNFTIDHCKAFAYWKPTYILTLSLLLKVKFRKEALLEFEF